MEPPPPYCETDIYSASGGARTANLTPTTSHADDASVARPLSDTASTADGSVIYTPPYTPDGSCNFNSSGLPEEAATIGLSPTHVTSSTAAAAYFESRSTQHTDDVLLVHKVTLKSGLQPRDLPFPQPETQWLQRDVTKQDWATFVNFLIPQHIDDHNNNVADRKLQAEFLDERMQRLTTEEGDRGNTDMSQVSAQLEPLMKSNAVNTRAEEVLAEWNEGFFSPRCLHLDLEISDELQSSPEDLAGAMPGAWVEAEEAAGAAAASGNRGGPSRRGGRGRGMGWIRANSDGFHVGKSLISADNDGFRIGKSALVADNNGFRMGNLLVADSNGFKLGNMVADSNGFRIGNMKFGGGLPPAIPGIPQPPGPPHRGRGRPPGRYPDNDGPTRNIHPHGHHGPHDSKGTQSGQAPAHRARSHSVSSSSSSSSSASEASIGSLPDYDNLTPAQLPVLKRSIQEWLEHPEQPITREAVSKAVLELRSATITHARTPPANRTAEDEVQLKAMRKEVRNMLIAFKNLKRAQRQKRYAEKREKKLKRREEKRQRKELKRQAKREAKDLRRTEKGKEKCKDKGKGRAHQPFSPPMVPPINVPFTPPNLPNFSEHPPFVPPPFAQHQNQSNNRQPVPGTPLPTYSQVGHQYQQPQLHEHLTGEAAQAWEEAQRIRADAEGMRNDAARSEEQAERFAKGARGSGSAEQEKMGLKLRDVAQGLREEADKLDAEAERLESQALAVHAEERGQESGVTERDG